MRHFLLCFTALLVSMLAVAQWTSVGNPVSEERDLTSFAISLAGVPYYVAHQYYNNTDEYKATVMKFDGTDWVPVGNPILIGRGDRPYLAISPAGVPYVAYADVVHHTATVMKFDGVDWVPVGYPYFFASYRTISLAISPAEEPYVAYADYTNGNKATVMKFDGTDWVPVGNAVSTEQVYYTSFAISPAGVPYLAYQDDGNLLKATVKKFDGADWVPVGNTAVVSPGQVEYISLAISPAGEPYVAYEDGYNSWKATVKKFDGADWVLVGNAGFSLGQVEYNSLAISPAGVPYLAYREAIFDFRITVKKFDGGDWVPVGNADVVSPAGAYYISLAISPDGVPYLAYRDADNSLAATVIVYDAITTEPFSGRLCSGAVVQVNYAATGYYSSNNTFTAQLSDASGSFANPVTIGSLASTSSGAINATIPSNSPAGSGYRIRVIADNPSVIGSDDGQDLTVNELHTWYQDKDGDGYGDIVSSIQDCVQPSGYVTNSMDCNDKDATVYLGAPELCDGRDNNCNGTIDEGCALISMTINDVAISEGSSSKTNILFTVALSKKSTQPVTVNYYTLNNTAKAPSDYVTKTGTLTFKPGTMRKTIAIAIKGDVSYESDETFKVLLTNIVNATIKDDTGIGTILNDDGAIAAGSTLKFSHSEQQAGKDQALSVKALPNPASDHFTLLINSSSIEPTNISITDMLGRVLESKTNISPNSSLRIGDRYYPGVYFAQVVQGTQRITVKLIKQPD